MSIAEQVESNWDRHIREAKERRAADRLKPPSRATLAFEAFHAGLVSQGVAVRSPKADRERAERKAKEEMEARLLAFRQKREARRVLLVNALVDTQEPLEDLARRLNVLEEELGSVAIQAIEVIRERNRTMPMRSQALLAGETPTVGTSIVEQIEKRAVFGWSPARIAKTLMVPVAVVTRVIAAMEEEYRASAGADADVVARDRIQRLLDHVTDQALRFGRGDTEEARENRRLIVNAACAMAKLHGANAATRHETKSLNVSISADETRKALANPQMRRLQMEIEQKEIEMSELEAENDA